MGDLLGHLLRGGRVAGAVLRIIGRHRAASLVALVLAVGWLVMGLGSSGAFAEEPTPSETPSATETAAADPSETPSPTATETVTVTETAVPEGPTVVQVDPDQWERITNTQVALVAGVGVMTLAALAGLIGAWGRGS